MKRKAIALALAMSMLATMTPLSGFAASVTDFKDVPASSWYYDSVKGALDDGFMNGISSDTFKPAGNLTRAMFVTMLARFDKAEVDNTASTSFTDVKTGQWHTGSVAWAVKNGIVTGYSAVKFGTDDNIKREDAAVMVYRYAQMKGLKLKEKNSPEFKDEAQISAHAKEAMDYCRKYSIFMGDQNDMVYPQKFITRAEAAAVIERIKNIVEESQTPVTPPNNGGSSGGGGGGGTTTTKYNIEWVVDANGTTKTTPVAKGDKLVPPVADSAMVREGYEFVGWSKIENDVPENAIKTANLPTASESAKYYPVWKKTETPAVEYEITWDANGGSWTDGTTKTTKATEGTTPTSPEDPVREGYTFIGWNTNPLATEKGTVTPAAKSETYYAVWVKTATDQFVIQWNLNYDGVPVLSPTTVNKGEIPVSPEIPERSGYVFVGWNENAKAETGNITPAFANTTYYAIWKEKEPVVYEITWDANGGSWTDGTVKKTQVKENTVPENPVEPVRADYIFMGWSIDEKATEPQNPSAATAAVTYYAVWAAVPPPEQITVKWNLNYPGGTIKTVNIDKGTKPADPFEENDRTRTGYTFKGWASSEDAAEAEFTAESPILTESKEYYAVWEANTYTIKWHLNYDGAPETREQSVKYDTQVTKPSEVSTERQYYTFLGWATDPDATEAEYTDIFPKVTGNADYYAVWKKQIFNVTWNLNDGDKTHKITVTTEAGTTAEPPEEYKEPVRANYRFLGWSRSHRDDAKPEELGKISGNDTYYAVWEAIEYNYVLDITAIVKNLTPFEIIPVDQKDDSAVDDQLTKYKVVYDEQGNIVQDKSDDIKLSSVASDLCNEDNIESILNALKGKSFTYNGITQTPIGEDGKINELIVGYMAVTENLPEGTAGQIADMIRNDKDLPDDIKNSVDADSVTTLLKKLDDGVTTDDANEILTSEEKVIAEKVSEKLDEYTGDKQDELLTKIKENESASNIVEQLGLSDDDIINMVNDYKDKLDAIIAAMNAAETASLLDDTHVTTKGGIPVVVNPVKAAKEQYSKGFDWYVQNLSKRLVNAGYVSQDRVDQLNLADSEAVKELYDSSNPDNWVSGDDEDGYFINSAETLASEMKDVVASLEKARHEYVVDKDASKVAEIIKKKYELAKTKPGSSMLPQLTDEAINKLAEIAVMEAPTLDDLEKAGFTEKEYSIARDLAADDALSIINGVFNRINNSAAQYVSDGVKQSIAEKAAGHYELHVKITKEEYTESTVN